MIDLVGKNGAFNDLYSSYRGRARKKGFEFTLTKLEFFLLTSAPCYYCGKKPEQSKAPNKYAAEYIYNGIDRLDSTLGYTGFNTVPCCKYCNIAKSVMTLDNFLEWISTVYFHMAEFQSAQIIHSRSA